MNRSWQARLPFLALSSVLALAGCAKVRPGETGRLPTLDETGAGGDEQFDIVWSGTVPRRVSISPDEPLRVGGTPINEDVAREVALEFVTANADFFKSQGLSIQLQSVSIEGLFNVVSFSQTVDGL